MPYIQCLKQHNKIPWLLIHIFSMAPVTLDRFRLRCLTQFPNFLSKPHTSFLRHVKHAKSWYYIKSYPFIWNASWEHVRNSSLPLILCERAEGLTIGSGSSWLGLIGPKFNPKIHDMDWWRPTFSSKIMSTSNLGIKTNVAQNILTLFTWGWGQESWSFTHPIL